MLDTSVLLHYKLPSDIDWLKAVNADEVEIVLTRTVISELNAHKDRRTSRWESKRADAAIKYLQRIWGDGMEAEIRKSTRLRLEPRSPLISFADHGLNKDVPDDWIIASAIELHKKIGEDLVVVTNDVGQAGVLRANGICTTYWADNEYRVQEEVDATEQENATLRRQVQEYENRVPRLRLEFEDGGQHRTFILSAMTTEQMKAELDRIWQMHSVGRRAYSALFDVPGYDWACREHYEAYERYLKDLSRYQEQVVCLDLTLANSGTCVAEDVDVYLSFSSDADVRDAYDPPCKPSPPDPREYERSIVDDVLGGGGVVLANLSSSKHAPKSNAVRPVVDSSTGSMSYHVPRAKHHQPVKLGALYVVFDEPGRAQSFSIRYRLLSSNVPQPVEGVLHVEVRTGQTEDRSEEETR